MADLQKKLTILPDNPLCGISTYKDTLDLSNGSVSRYVRKTILTGTETITTQKDYYWNNTALFVYRGYTTGYSKRGSLNSHFVSITTNPQTTNYESSGFNDASTYSDYYYMRINYSTIGITGDESYADCANAFKTWLAQQYANGTPVTIYFYVSTPTTETVTVPSGLSGTEEGYLNQSGTPTPTNPIYPTANNVEIWLHSLRKLGTATDTITTLPAVLYPNDTTATVGLKGNMSQSSTPTPTTPIQPSETGERTANLFDYQQTQGITDNCFINQNRQIVSNDEYYISYPIYVTQGGTYTWQFNRDEADGRHTAPTVGYYDANDNLISVAQHAVTILNFVFTTPQNCAYIRCSVFKRNNLQTQAQLNVGSSVLPYQPYGYKIPISSANTTTPVYLGQVQSTRKIKKLVLDGTEDWQIYGQVPNTYRLSISNTQSIGNPAICSHFVNSPISEITSGKFTVGSTWIYFRYEDATDLADFKSYLAQQYANGTPVTVWYVLATATTGIVNEPIRKIGDYADTVSGISIPTITGKDSFDVLTTLKPSEVELTYTGWHDATVKEWDGSQWQ